jgi:uncharacterized protein YbbC (DUF1343 family)
MHYSFLLAFVLTMFSCQSPDKILTGADQMERYLPLLEGKSIAIVANHTSEINGTHLVDTLLSSAGDQFEIKIIQKVFVPEHGFRGDFDAGAGVSDEIDLETGIPIVSLYGNHKKPRPEDLEGIDMVLFDIQDVGVRFYTYISTLHYVMEACAENNVPLLVLDRPNPNGGYIDGPILEKEHRSFIGMHPIPVVYGLTIGELAQMINGEGWLNNGEKCDLSVIPCASYSHGLSYELPVTPSPNLPNSHTILLYPSTCFFEGTVISEGRGTMMPFEVFGHPDLPGEFSYTPVSIPGMSTYPKLLGEECYGSDLRTFEPKKGWKQLHLHWLIEAYNSFPDQENFFTPFFEKLSGTVSLREQIISGMSADEIRESWQGNLEIYNSMRLEYLLYK